MIKDGKVLCPLIFSAHPANLFLQIYANQRFNREELAVFYEAAETAFGFQRNGDVYGRMFSVWEKTRYMFPTLSGYKPVRKYSMDLYNTMKVSEHFFIFI